MFDIWKYVNIEYDIHVFYQHRGALFFFSVVVVHPLSSKIFFLSIPFIFFLNGVLTFVVLNSKTIDTASILIWF